MQRKIILIKQANFLFGILIFFGRYYFRLYHRLLRRCPSTALREQLLAMTTRDRKGIKSWTNGI